MEVTDSHLLEGIALLINLVVENRRQAEKKGLDCAQNGLLWLDRGQAI
jgi:hypothetical protein